MLFLGVLVCLSIVNGGQSSVIKSSKGRRRSLLIFLMIQEDYSAKPERLNLICLLICLCRWAEMSLQSPVLRHHGLHVQIVQGNVLLRNRGSDGPVQISARMHRAPNVSALLKAAAVNAGEVLKSRSIRFSTGRRLNAKISLAVISSSWRQISRSFSAVRTTCATTAPSPSLISIWSITHGATAIMAIITTSPIPVRIDSPRYIYIYTLRYQSPKKKKDKKRKRKSNDSLVCFQWTICNGNFLFPFPHRLKVFRCVVTFP